MNKESLRSSLKSSLKVSVIDPSVVCPATSCFNQLVDNFEYSFSYHIPTVNGMCSLLDESSPAAYIVLGSHSNLNEKLSWQKDLALFLKEKIQLNIPVLGICFGHQMIANIFGGTIGKVKEEDLLSGTRVIKFVTPWMINKETTPSIFITHSYEVKTLPKGFSLLATSKDCLIDGMISDDYNCITFQGHPEASDSFINRVIKQELSAKEITLAKKAGHIIIKNFLDSIDK